MVQGWGRGILNYTHMFKGSNTVRHQYLPCHRPLFSGCRACMVKANPCQRYQEYLMCPIGSAIASAVGSVVDVHCPAIGLQCAFMALPYVWRCHGETSVALI